MRLFSKALILCLAAFAPLAFASSDGISITVGIQGDSQPVPCEQNPNITPSLQICAFDYDGARQYRIDTSNGSHVRFSMLDGDVNVQSTGRDAVRVALTKDASYSGGIVTALYRDAAVEIDSLVNAKNRVTWVVRPLAPVESGVSEGKCSGAGCSVNSYTSPMANGKCSGAGCSVNSYTSPMTNGKCSGAGCSVNSDTLPATNGKCSGAGCSVNSYVLPLDGGKCTAAGCSVNSGE